MKRSRLVIIDEVGLHARPAKEFVTSAGEYDAKVKVRNISRDTGWVNARSIMGVLTLGAEKGHELEIEAEGSQEKEVVEALEKLMLVQS